VRQHSDKWTFKYHFNLSDILYLATWRFKWRWCN